MFLVEIVETGDKYRGVTRKRCGAFPEGPVHELYFLEALISLEKN